MVMFSLCCQQRDRQKYAARYDKYSDNVKISTCNVNVRFQWSEQDQTYKRIEPFKIVHDHTLELDKRVLVSKIIFESIK